MGISHWMARSAAALALVCASLAGHAEVFSDRCSGCTFQQQANVARQLVPPGAAPGSHEAYIVDYEAETLTRFHLMVVHEPWDGLSYTVATPAPVPAAVQQQFAIDVAALKAFVVMSEDITREVPDDLADSAFEYLGNSGSRNRVHFWISDSLGFLERTAVYFTGFVRILELDIQFVVPIRFADGSSVLIEFRGEVDGEMYWRAIDGSARDADGNTIHAPHATVNGFIGSYGDEGRAETMRQYLRFWFTHLQCDLIANGNETILRCRRVTVSR